jgi:hypothetical protein
MNETSNFVLFFTLKYTYKYPMIYLANILYV